MVDCPELEELNTKYRIAKLRYGRFIDSLKGLNRTDRDKEEAAHLEVEMDEAERALMRHQAEHGCRG